MIYTIKNDFLSVEINSSGAEVFSIKRNDVQYLWQNEIKDGWQNRATVLFPTVGRLQDGKYTFEGKTYEMGIHGIARYYDFKVLEQTENKIVFLMESDEESAKSYPFVFNFIITYELEENKILMNFKVLNKDEKPMYFGLGGHPGFITPLEEGLSLEDYYIEFDEKCSPKRLNTSAAGLIEGVSDYKLEDDRILRIKPSIFDNDAIILENMSIGATLKSDKSDKSVYVRYEDMKFLAIWQTPHKAPNFICIEPWTAVPGRDSIIEDFANRPNFITLEPNREYNNNWYIQINA